MAKHIVAVFAHPDDEAFGPSGTLLMETAAGTVLHLVLLTAGAAGKNVDGSNLAARRLEEWRQSGQLLGASSQHFLDYEDGQLNNQSMQKITEKVVDIIQQQALEADEIEVMSFEFGGISGHIDHIVAARAAAAAFYKLKSTDYPISRLRLFCLPETVSPSPRADWIFTDKGYPESEISEVIDARHLEKQIVEVMNAHASQSEDAAYIRRLHGKDFGLNRFLVRN